MGLCETINLSFWDDPISASVQKKAIASLERGQILYLPTLGFALQQKESACLDPRHVDPRRKNISFDLSKELLQGAIGQQSALQEMMKRYALCSSNFVKRLLPAYVATLQLARTSFRPTEIEGRKSSVRKDDTRLHVDAFPSTPTRGRRILRMFTNINPEGKPRIWRGGEPFEEVVKKYAKKVPSPLPGSALLLSLLKVTKGKRSSYDHWMLHLHNKMKEDEFYQQKVSQEELLFPPGSSWIVFTDQVSHAAMKGQHVLEQTFSLPVEGLSNPSTSPLRVLERVLQKPLLQ